MFKIILGGTFSFLVCAMNSNVLFAQSHFEYGGIGLEPFDLKKRFPTSLVQNEEAWLSKSDSRGHVYYLKRTYMKDKTEIKMVLEKPEKYLSQQPKTWEEGHYAKFPGCKEVLTKLIGRYGKPKREEQSPEERLEHRVRIWSQGDEILKLDCYQIDGKGKELAAEIMIEHSSDR